MYIGGERNINIKYFSVMLHKNKWGKDHEKRFILSLAFRLCFMTSCAYNSIKYQCIILLLITQSTFFSKIQYL